MKLFYSTENGEFYLGDSLEILTAEQTKKYRGKVNLIVTSPPFPLNNKKNMGMKLERNIKNGFKS